MAWPSGTKAGTTNVDAGSDKPALARPDIKQNIDNVNSIIDTFDIASPSNGDILVYNSTSSAWEPEAQTAAGIDCAVLTSNGIYDTSVGTYYRYYIKWGEQDPNGIVSVNATTGVFTLGAGNYMMTILAGQNNGTQFDLQFYDQTGSSIIQNFTSSTTHTITQPVCHIKQPSGSNEYRLATNTSSTGNTNGEFIIQIIKF